MNICMVQRAARALLPGVMGVVGVMTLAHAPHARAQSSRIVSASVETCNVRAVVRTTVLGVTTTAPLACINPTARAAPGEDRDELVGALTVGVPAVVSVVTATGPEGASSWVDAPQRTRLVGETGTAALSIAQGGIQITGVTGRLTCESESDGDVISCAAETTVGSVTVAGRAVSLPASPLPVNHTIAVSGLRLTVGVLGLQLSIPVTGELVLNGVTIAKQVGEFRFEHAPLALNLRGSVQALGLGLVGIELEMLDFAAIEVATQ
jgi:hypothetical protein